MQKIDGVRDGLEGVLAFASEIAEPDRDGGALRYRGVDVEELVGTLPFEGVWGLLVDGRPDRPLAPAGPHPLEPAHRRHAGRRAVGDRRARTGVGLRAARRRQPRGRPRPARADGLGHALVRRPVRTRRRRRPGAAVADRRGPDAGRALSAALARRGRPRRGRRDRRLLGHGRRARDERLDVHRPGRGLDRRRRGRGAQRRGRRALGPAARRCARARAADARRRRSAPATPTPTWPSCSTAASGSWASATASTAPRTRAPGCCAGSPSGSARRACEVARELERAALAALRGAQARPRARDQRRVLVGRRARPRARAAVALHAAVRVRAYRRAGRPTSSSSEPPAG